jgi:hypothetical protein
MLSPVKKRIQETPTQLGPRGNAILNLLAQIVRTTSSMFVPLLFCLRTGTKPLLEVLYLNLYFEHEMMDTVQ